MLFSPVSVLEGRLSSGRFMHVADEHYLCWDGCVGKERRNRKGWKGRREWNGIWTGKGTGCKSGGFTLPSLFVWPCPRILPAELTYSSFIPAELTHSSDRALLLRTPRAQQNSPRIADKSISMGMEKQLKLALLCCFFVLLSSGTYIHTCIYIVYI